MAAPGGNGGPDTRAASADRPLRFNGEVTALFASMWSPVPVFHAFSHEVRRERDDTVSADYTRCGLLVSSYNRETKRFKENLTWVPMRHALAFGKPCRKCFPDASWGT